MVRGILYVMVLGLAAGLAVALPKQLDKVKQSSRTEATRGLLDFGFMIYCGTGWNPLDYNNYGCYCGFGGHGTPKDDVDRCCKAHDQCYDRVHASGACPFQAAAYTFPYSTTSCTSCRPSSWYWFYGKCRHALCECDAEAVRCFHRSTYHNQYAGYDKNRC